MQPLITQLTAYSCVLDCWAHFMRERGNQISTEEILKNHRDLCWSRPHPHEYGSIDKQRFEHLVRRYLMQCSNFAPTLVSEIEERIQKGRGVFVVALHYRGNHHMLRAVGTVADKVQVLIPALPYGIREDATIDHIQKVWGGEFLDVG